MDCGRKSILIVYDCKTERFTCPARMENSFGPDPGGRPLWQRFAEDGICSAWAAEELKSRFREMVEAGTPQAVFGEYEIRGRLCQVGFVCADPGGKIAITCTSVGREETERTNLGEMPRDTLTGLLNRISFCEAVEQILKDDAAGAMAGEYSAVYFDVVKFKAVNEVFGAQEGDRLLCHIAKVLRRTAFPGDVISRLGSDRFILFTHMAGAALDRRLEDILSRIAGFDPSVPVVCSAGVYRTEERLLSAETMIDRAILARSAIESSYTERYHYYDDSLRRAMLGEQEIIGMMETALEEGQFLVYYQPQYNHSTGMLVGAEALVRWQHPERGLLSPGVFVPIFEKNWLITKLDLYVFRQVCHFLKSCMERDLPMVPVSVNFSRHDIYSQNFVEKLEAIRESLGVPVQYLRAEITESSVMGDGDYANRVIRQLHDRGYIVEMDDFGSGYSCLNVLREIDLDLIKLDMLFLQESPHNERGGTILASVVRMAKWMGLPVIAEGVEKVSQADFLRSIGCDCIQGYLYSRPLPREAYEELLRNSTVGALVTESELAERLDVGKFWDPESLDTLVFSNYVGGAAVFSYEQGRTEILRVNQRYLKEIRMDLSEKDLICMDPLSVFDEENRAVYMAMLERAIGSAKEEECETWRGFSSAGGSGRVCVRSHVRMIGKNGDHILFYAMIRNITAEKERLLALQDVERRYLAARPVRG